MSYIKTEDGHVYDESKTVLSTLLGTRVIQVSDEIEPLLEDFLEEVGNGNMQRPFYQSFVNSLLGLAKNLEREMSNGIK